MSRNINHSSPARELQLDSSADDIEERSGNYATWMMDELFFWFSSFTDSETYQQPKNDTGFARFAILTHFLHLRDPVKNVRLRKKICYTIVLCVPASSPFSRNSVRLISIIISYLSHSLNSEMIINNMIFIFDRLSCSMELATSCRDGGTFYFVFVEKCGDSAIPWRRNFFSKK